MSRVLGFVREMLMAAALGTGPVADAFNAAFQFPNTFRRLFAEGAFNAAFVPLFAKEIEADGIDGAKRFSEEVFGVLFTVLTAITIADGTVDAAAGGDHHGAGLRRRSAEIRADAWRSPPSCSPIWSACRSAAMMSGMLNSLRRYFAAAIAPVFLNIILIGVLAYAWYEGHDGLAVGYGLAWGVLAAGLVQLAIVWGAVRHAGITIGFRRPRLTPNVKRLLWLALPGGGHRRHHPDQSADRHDDRLRPGQRGVVAGLCRPHLPAAARRRRHRGGDRSPARARAGVEVRQSRRGRQTCRTARSSSRCS